MDKTLFTDITYHKEMFAHLNNIPTVSIPVKVLHPDIQTVVKKYTDATCIYVHTSFRHFFVFDPKNIEHPYSRIDIDCK